MVKVRLTGPAWVDRQLAAEVAAKIGAPAPFPDREKLIAEATEFIDSWDRLGSWTPDSPIGMVMRLRNALAAPLDPEKVAAIIWDLVDVSPERQDLLARALCEAYTEGKLT